MNFTKLSLMFSLLFRYCGCSHTWTVIFTHRHPSSRYFTPFRTPPFPIRQLFWYSVVAGCSAFVVHYCQQPNRLWISLSYYWYFSLPPTFRYYGCISCSLLLAAWPLMNFTKLLLINFSCFSVLRLLPCTNCYLHPYFDFPHPPPVTFLWCWRVDGCNAIILLLTVCYQQPKCNIFLV